MTKSISNTRPTENQLVKITEAEFNGEILNSVDARDLHNFLEISKQFTDWIYPKIKDYGFVINSDFCKSETIASNGRKMETYLLSLKMAMCICINATSPKAYDAYEYLCSILGKGVIIKWHKRAEFAFDEVVMNLFSNFKVISQYPVFGGKYRIDWYIPELKLAIEFDEPYHFCHWKEDKDRQLEIEKELGCKFARYTV